ncbi:MAG TPA: succinate dehydrogenase, cytochrome b556 subunit [Burkholderiales bacterium]|nr:succinate dehydrogenase, cytochrome b556 subunit [Burkholderiales bacterium]
MPANIEAARRPKYLNPLRVRLPLPGIISILHRVSGALLFLALPLMLYAFQQSLASPAAFAAFKTALGHWYSKMALLALLWTYFHHLCAGLRHLALDLHIGVDLRSARRSARLTLVTGIALTVLAAVLLW